MFKTRATKEQLSEARDYAIGGRKRMMEVARSCKKLGDTDGMKRAFRLARQNSSIVRLAKKYLAAKGKRKGAFIRAAARPAAT